jgi:hypothetical protein
MGRTCRLISEICDNSTEMGMNYVRLLRYARSRLARRSRFLVECVMQRYQAPLSRARQTGY